MSVKGIGNPGVLRPLDTIKKNSKKEGVKSFDDSMKKVAVQKDSAQISGNLRPAMNSDYSSLGQLSAKNAVKQSVLQPVVSKVLDDPEPFNQRVAEIKKLISEGGVEAYFNTVDSEKIAQRLLNSGVLDDLI
jgi:anti-sigma28 factor (negative regulator of flagellin synthesis)